MSTHTSPVVYSSVFGAVMTSLPAVRTRLVVFDTAIVDLSDKLEDPVDVLFSVQLGSGQRNYEQRLQGGERFSR